MPCCPRRWAAQLHHLIMVITASHGVMLVRIARNCSCSFRSSNASSGKPSCAPMNTRRTCAHAGAPSRPEGARRDAQPCRRAVPKRSFWMAQGTPGIPGTLPRDTQLAWSSQRRAGRSAEAQRRDILGSDLSGHPLFRARPPKVGRRWATSACRPWGLSPRSGVPARDRTCADRRGSAAPCSYGRDAGARTGAPLCC